MLFGCFAFLLVLRVIIDFSLQHYVEAFPPAKLSEKEKKEKEKDKKKLLKEKEKINASAIEDAMTPKKKTD